MSNWTHVAAIFRVDGFYHDYDFTKIFGKELNFNDSIGKRAESETHPEQFLPLGSEGSLKMSIWENPDYSCVAAYTVSIFGDLRDHNSIDEIINWFDEKCKGIWIRQAVITVENEMYGTSTKTYRYEEYRS